MNARDVEAARRPRTIDECCGDPPGTFAQFCKDHPDIDQYIAEQKYKDLKPRQWVVCAAIRSSAGKIIAGARHYDSVMRPLAFPGGERSGEWIACEQGFIDQFGAFLTREDAWKIAFENKQIKDPKIHSAGVLYSEDLY